MTSFEAFKISIAKTDVFAIECLDQDFVRGFTMNHMDLGGDEDSWEIERAHRSPTGPPRENRVRPIHVKFLRYQDRVKILKAASSKLKDNPFTPPNSLRSSNVYISDDVTEIVR